MWSGYSEAGRGSQERGPGGFSFNPPGVQQGRPAHDAVQVQGGIRGSGVAANTAQPVRIDQGQDRTLAALLKFGQDAIAPHIEKAREAKFVQGVQRAASGEALTGIINEQPWYTKIFGDGPLVEGARAYEVQSRAEAWAGAHDNAMGELRLRSPNEVPAYLMKSMEEHLTGDEATDTLIKANMIKVLPQLIKRHTREHYKYQQENASAQRVNAMFEAGNSIQTAHQADPGMYTDEEKAARIINMLSVSTPTEGSDPDAYERDVKNVLGLHMQKGNFHALNAYEQAGVLEHMKPEDRIALGNSMRQYSAFHAGQAAQQYVTEIAQIKEDAALGRITEAQVEARYNAINADYQSKSGNPAPIIRKSEFIGDMKTAGTVHERMEAKTIKDLTEAKTDEERTAQARHGIANGSAFILKEAGTKVAGDVDSIFYGMYKELGKTEGFAATVPMLVANARGGYINPSVRSEIQSIVRSGQADTINTNFVAAHGIWKALQTAPNGGRYAAAGYFTDEEDMRMRAFDAALGDRDINTFGELAFQSSMKQRVTPGHVFSKEEAKAAMAAVEGAFGRPWYTFSGSITAEAQREILAAMQGPYGTLKNHPGGSGDPMKDALARAKANGLEVYGDHAWRTGPDRKPLNAFFRTTQGTPLDDSSIGSAVNVLVEEKMAEFTDGTPDSYLILRSADRDGQAHFLLYITVDGVTKTPQTFSSVDIKAAHGRALQKRIAKEQPPSLTAPGQSAVPPIPTKADLLKRRQYNPK